MVHSQNTTGEKEVRIFRTLACYCAGAVGIAACVAAIVIADKTMSSDSQKGIAIAISVLAALAWSAIAFHATTWTADANPSCTNFVTEHCIWCASGRLRMRVQESASHAPPVTAPPHAQTTMMATVAPPEEEEVHPAKKPPKHRKHKDSPTHNEPTNAYFFAPSLRPYAPESPSYYYPMQQQNHFFPSFSNSAAAAAFLAAGEHEPLVPDVGSRNTPWSMMWW